MKRRSNTLKTQPPADHHPLLPGVAIGALSLLLAAGLETLGTLDFINQFIANQIAPASDLPHHLPLWGIWLATSGLAFGLAFAVLHVECGWKRAVLWITSLAVVAGWAPVLVLAAHAPEIAAGLIVTFWSGLCALVYAQRHTKSALPISNKPSDEIH